MAAQRAVLLVTPAESAFMFVDPALAAITSLSPQLPSGLLLGTNEGKPDFLVCAAGGVVVAVGLTAHVRFKFIDVTTTRQSFRGCFLSDVEIQVDPTSYFTTFSRYPVPGDIVIDNAKVYVAALSADPYANAVNIEWDGALNVGAGAIEGGFSRWRIIQRQRLADEVFRDVDSEAGPTE
jgi:hypothetical protein